MLELRPLVKSDVEAALRLSTQAGWNQITADWQRLIALWPNSCIAVWGNGALVATGTLAVYGQTIGWVGMILVEESCRGRGHGGTILDHLLKLADDSGIAHTGLDATDLGRPVYIKRGFHEYAPVNRWTRPAGAIRSAGAANTLADGDCQPIDDRSWAEVLKLDRGAVGVDRTALLRQLASEHTVAGLALSCHGRTAAAGFLRPGRTASAIGPLVGESARDAAKLLHALVAQTPPNLPIFFDAVGGSAIEETLTELGFTIQRHLVRMFRPAIHETVVPLTGPRVFAGTSFALG